MNVRFYDTVADEEPAREYMRARDAKQRALIGQKIRAIQDVPLMPGNVDVKQVRERLMELRIGFHRIFYVVTTGPVMWLLHACQKEGDKAKAFDISVAMRRMRDLLARLGE